MSKQDKEVLRRELNDELEIIMAELGMAEAEKYMWEVTIAELESEQSMLVSKINDTWVDV